MGMTIKDGLKLIIANQGKEILNTSRCFNILADYGVFKNYPGYSNIFRGIVECGYGYKMLSLSRWDEGINQWSFDLANKKGYNLDWTKDIFLQIAEALGLVNSNNNSIASIDSKIEFDFVPKTSSSSFENYFKSLINLKEIISEGNKIGLNIDNFHLRVRQYAWQFDANIPYGYIDVSLELYRFQKLKRIRKLWMALYDKNERIIKKFSIGEMRNDDSELKPCIGSTGVELDKVAKIILFWG